jgi:N-acetylglucosaminyl-diphospho-decaprenol L-rhamnosyltransferase
MKVLIVIVNYRVAHLTIDCLRSLKDEVAAVPGTHVAVVENGTGDDSAERIARAIESGSWGSWVTLTAIHPNRGFTGGNNVAIRSALEQPDPPELFWLLNADTVVSPGALRALLAFMETHPQAGIAGGRPEYPDGVVQRSAFRFISVASEFENRVRLGLLSRLLARWAGAPPPPPAATRVDWVSGVSMIVRRAVFQHVGLLDEGLYTYFDDIDLCYNARRAGWETWYVPQSRIVHYVGESTGVTKDRERPGRRPDYWFEARRYFLLKNYGAAYAAITDFAWVLGHSLWLARRLVERKPDIDPPRFLRDFVRHSVLVTGFGRRPVKNPAKC